MKYLAVLRATVLLAGVAAAASGDIVVSAKTTVLIGSQEPVALRKAAADLAGDLGKVFGSPARVVHRLSDAGASTICISLAENLPPGMPRAAGREILQIRAAAKPWKSGPDAVILTGSDLRGAIYAVYEFSGKYLGVDPMYYWTDRMPSRRATVAVPEGLSVQDGPPTFRYRGWFTNDEDLLTGWKPGTADGTGISLAVWDKVFETILRLKGNMIVPGTFIFPDEPQVKAAGERGLIITQHHIEVLGTNTYRWPEDKPYSFTAHPDLLEAAWSAAVRQYANREVIWTLGYRGRHDRAFWVDDASAGATDAERAKTIQRAIATQMDIVGRERQKPFFLMNAWMESVPFIHSGLLQIPSGVSLVWPDNGHGVIRDDGRIRAGEGVYYHTAMYNSMANQLTEMVPLERIQRELGRAAKARATEYLLINTSDIRPVVMTTRAAMELAWNAKPWIEDPAQAGKYLEQWCREEFGAAAAPAVAQYYRAYFEAPGRYGSGETQTLADNAYHTVSREILLRLIRGETSVPARSAAGAQSLAEYAAKYGGAAREAEPRWAQARRLAGRAAKLIPPASHDVFLAAVEIQLAIHESSNRMLLEVARAATEPAPEKQSALIESAIGDAQTVLQALEAAEYGKWAGFYRHELFVSVRHTIALARAYQAKLAGRPLPADVPISILPVDPYVVIKAYQAKRRVSF